MSARDAAAPETDAPRNVAPLQPATPAACAGVSPSHATSNSASRSRSPSESRAARNGSDTSTNTAEVLPVTLTGQARHQHGPALLPTRVIREDTTRHAVQPRERFAVQTIQRPPGNQERVADHILDNRGGSTSTDVRRDLGMVALEQRLEPLLW